MDPLIEPPPAALHLPYGTSPDEYRHAADGVENALAELNGALAQHGLSALEEIITTSATLSALISDLYAGALADATAALVVNRYHNGHPDLVPTGVYPGDAVAAGDDGVEVKATRNTVSDAHGAREAWWCQVRYQLLPAAPAGQAARGTRVRIVEVQVAYLLESDFRSNDRHTKTGTRTATPHKGGLAKLRAGSVFQRPLTP